MADEEVLSRLLALFTRHNLDEEVLDEAVHDDKSVEASNINNAGVEAQLKYLLEGNSAEDVEVLIEKAADAACERGHL